MMFPVMLMIDKNGNIFIQYIRNQQKCCNFISNPRNSLKPIFSAYIIPLPGKISKEKRQFIARKTYQSAWQNTKKCVNILSIQFIFHWQNNLYCIFSFLMVYLKKLFQGNVGKSFYFTSFFCATDVNGRLHLAWALQNNPKNGGCHG